MMLPDRGQSPADQWYYQPLTDRSAIGQQKIDQLQRQINSLEDDSQERQRLIERLTRLQEKEREQKGLQDRVISRNSPVSRLLQDEVEKLYGAESVAALNPSRTPVDRNVIERVIQHRTKEFSNKQQEAALQAKYLDKERQRLQEARHRVQEQRRMLLSSVSPSGQPGSPKPREVHGVDSYLQQTVSELPNTLDKIFKMRTDLEQHYLFYRKPYNGELGIDTYEPWQIPDYAMCREIVHDVVDDFLNLYFKDVSVVEKGTYKAMLEEEEKWMSRQSEALSEKRAIQLISEELYLDETSNMITDVINEMYHLYGTFRNLTDGMLMEVAETVSTGQEGGRDPSDKTYDLVTKSYFTTKHNRNRHRKEVWGHSQHAQNKIRRRAITKKKEGYVEEEEAEEEERLKTAPVIVPIVAPGPGATLSPVPESPEIRAEELEPIGEPIPESADKAIPTQFAEVVADIEYDDEGDELDAPDLTVLDFNNLSPVPSRSLPISPIDAPDVSLDKEYFQRYSRREVEYWSNIYTSLTHVDITKRCHGIRTVRPSPNHRFVAVGTQHGDIFILDALMKPWRPFRAMLNNSREDQYAVSISWSLDSTRLIVINSVGVLQVLSINAGSPHQDPAQKLGLKPDDKGVFAHQLRVLLELDVEKQDFIFHQGILAEEKAQDDVGLVPVRGAFFPSLSFLGIQNDMVVALDNGDVLKCNFQNILDNQVSDPKGQTSKTQPAIKNQNPKGQANVNTDKNAQGQNKNEAEKDEGETGETEGQGQGEQEESGDVAEIETTKIYHPLLVPNTEASEVNTIGQGVEAELMRGHKKSIIHMSFVENLNALVTVDTKGNVYKWKYSLKYKSSFGWFIPTRKYKVETNKVMFQEKGTDKPKVVFTDKTAPGKKPRTRQEVAAGRRRAQNTIDNMQLGEPWHEEYLKEEDMLVQVYAPRGHIPSSGAMFHVLYRHPETNLLSTYLTRLYGSLKIKCTRIVRVIGSPTGTALVFILLFNKYPPKSAHITIFVLDLTVMELRDFRKDVPLSDQEYATMLKKNIISCDISRVYSSTGTDYLFVMYSGKLHGISLLTGQEIFRVDKVRGPLQVELDGCTLDKKDLPLPVDAECTCVGFEGKLSCLVYARKVNRLSKIEFDDRNQYATRRAMWKSYSILSDHKVVPAELRVNTFNWALEDIVHPAVAARKMLLKTLDTELRRAGHIRDPPSKIKKLGLSDKVEDYRALEKAVTQSGLLEKEGVLGRRRGGDGSDLEDFDDDDENKF